MTRDEFIKAWNTHSSGDFVAAVDELLRCVRKQAHDAMYIQTLGEAAVLVEQEPTGRQGAQILRRVQAAFKDRK